VCANLATNEHSVLFIPLAGPRFQSFLYILYDSLLTAHTEKFPIMSSEKFLLDSADESTHIEDYPETTHKAFCTQKEQQPRIAA